MNRLKCFFGFHKWFLLKERGCRLYFLRLEQCDYCGKFKDTLKTLNRVYIDVLKECPDWYRDE